MDSKITETDYNKIPEKQRLACILEGTAYYASVHTPNMSSVKKFKGQPAFTVSLMLEGDQLQKAIDMGLTIKEPTATIPGRYVELKRKVPVGVDPSEKKPDVVDPAQNPIPPTILIGNGSKVRCKFATYWSDHPAYGGVKASLYKVQVLDLIRFVPQDRDFVADKSFKGFGDAADYANQTSTASAATDDFDDEIPPFDTEEPKATLTPTKKRATAKDMFD